MSDYEVELQRLGEFPQKLAAHLRNCRETFEWSWLAHATISGGCLVCV